MANFREALANCDLTDVGFVGLPYTYDNARAANANVKVRLDRALADTGWRDIFGDAKLHHLISSRSDQLVLEVRRESWERHKPRIFRYEIMWERLEMLATEVKQAWCSAPDRECLGGVMAALQCVQRALWSWSKQHFGSVSKEHEKLSQPLEEARSAMIQSREEVRSITDRMDELLYREEMMWLQRSRLTWLKEGDRNTSYFHRQAVWRARKNKIRKLKMADGTWCERKEDLHMLTTNVFQRSVHCRPACRWCSCAPFCECSHISGNEYRAL